MFLLSFVRDMQYLFKFQKIWHEAQIILRIPRVGYCMFFEHFVLWTWIQHALNVFKLNWSFVLLWLSTWFTIPPWKTFFKPNLQYPYIKGVKYFNIYLFVNEWKRPSSMQYLHFIFPHHCQPLGVYWIGNHVGRCNHVGGVW
jgi:hypothetical protein